MAKQEKCATCGEHKSRMVYFEGAWLCGDCYDKPYGVVAVPTFVGLPSTARLRSGWVGKGPTNRSWTR